MNDWRKWSIVIFIGIATIAGVALVGIPLSPGQRTVTETILIGGLLIAFAGALILQLWPSAELTASADWCARFRPCVAWLLALGGGGVVVFVLVWILVKFPDVSTNCASVPTNCPGILTNSASMLPLVVLVGVIVLLIVIGLVTFTYSVLGLASPTEALGLPDGSVRAIIALMLVVLFSIVSIFLYNSVVSGGVLRSVSGVTNEQVEGMRSQVTVVLTQPDKTAGQFTVYYRNGNSAGDDIAKQLIVLLGTLVTAVASFYFGSNAVASANAAVLGSQKAPPPKVTAITPNPIKPGGEAQTLTLTGTNLGTISRLHLEQKGQSDIDAQHVTRGDTTVTAQVTIPSVAKGTWDVVVEDGANALTIGHIEVKTA